MIKNTKQKRRRKSRLNKEIKLFMKMKQMKDTIENNPIRKYSTNGLIAKGKK
jgi:hypothetical protein